MSIFNDLKKYLESTPREKIESDWAKYKMYDSVGITIDEFLNKSPTINNNGNHERCIMIE
jgi:hypothetical protein